MLGTETTTQISQSATKSQNKSTNDVQGGNMPVKRKVQAMTVMVNRL